MVRKIAIALLLTLGLLGSSIAGELDKFEKAVAKPVKRQKRSRTNYDDKDSGKIGAGIAVRFVQGVYHGAKYVAYGWWAAPEEDRQYGESFAPTAASDHGAYAETELEGQDELKHKLGTPGLPYVRFDYRWQYLDSDTSANDYFLEMGYKHVAAYGRITQYEGAANEKLDIEQYYGMLRYGGSDDFLLPGSFQVGAGIGGYSIKGPSKTQNGAALTVPITFCPADWIGFEFRPAWAVINERKLSDYDLSVSLGDRFVHFRGGYRWLWVQHEGHWLNGPYAGVSISF